MRNFILKSTFTVILLIVITGFVNVWGQTVSLYLTDDGSTIQTGDYYEISWVAFKDSPLTFYSCTPVNTITPAPASNPIPLSFFCNVPDTEYQIFRVEVAVKRRNISNVVVASGRNITGYMNTVQIQGSWNISVTIN